MFGQSVCIDIIGERASDIYHTCISCTTFTLKAVS